MSTGFNAGIDSSDVVFSYGEEVVWNTLPAVQFQAIRLLSESLSETKSRTRPPEIRADGQAAHALTTQVSAAGSIGLGFSLGTYDDLLGGMLGDTLSTALAIDDATNDMDGVLNVEASGNPGFTSSVTDKFNDIKVGQWIRTFGWIASSGANNGIFRVLSVTTGASAAIQVYATEGDAANIIDETPASGTQGIRGQFMRNGVEFRSWYFQKTLAAALYLTYPGSYITGGTMTAELGGFFQGTLEVLSASEQNLTSDQSTGAVLDAPSGRVIDTVAGISNLFVGGAITSIIQSLSLNMTKENARGQYGIGNLDSNGDPTAAGMGRGTMTVSGALSIYFNDFTQYQLYKDETDTIISFRAFDNTDAGYIITLPAATLVNPSIVAGGPDTDIVANFELEGNPLELDAADGAFTVQIDKIPAAL